MLESKKPNWESTEYTRGMKIHGDPQLISHGSYRLGHVSSGSGFEVSTNQHVGEKVLLFSLGLDMLLHI